MSLPRADTRAPLVIGLALPLAGVVCGYAWRRYRGFWAGEGYAGDLVARTNRADPWRWSRRSSDRPADDW